MNRSELFPATISSRGGEPCPATISSGGGEPCPATISSGGGEPFPPAHLPRSQPVARSRGRCLIWFMRR